MDRAWLAYAFRVSPVSLRDLTMGEARAMRSVLAEVARARKAKK